jgi:hypothetical protein
MDFKSHKPGSPPHSPWNSRQVQKTYIGRHMLKRRREVKKEKRRKEAF